jgi:hypothetical protein
MRDDIRRAFDEMTEAPHPALPSALRARLAAGMSRGSSPIWRFAPVAAVIAVVALAAYGGFHALLISHGGPGGGLAGVPSPSPTVTLSPAPSPTSEISPAVSPSPSPAYFCGSAEAGTRGTNSNVTGVRVGTESGFDRFVIEFDGPVPAVSVEPQSSSTFTQSASGQQLVLRGQSGILVIVNGTTANPGGAPTYSGPTDFQPGYPVLAEAHLTQDFERVYSWGLGLNLPPRTSCVHVFTLTGPDRLVIDIKQP